MPPASYHRRTARRSPATRQPPRFPCEIDPSRSVDRGVRASPSPSPRRETALRAIRPSPRAPGIRDPHLNPAVSPLELPLPARSSSETPQSWFLGLTRKLVALPAFPLAAAPVSGRIPRAQAGRPPLQTPP